MYTDGAGRFEGPAPDSECRDLTIISLACPGILLNFLPKQLQDNQIVAASPKIKHAYLRNTIWWAGLNIDWSYLKFQKTMNLKKKRIQDHNSFEGVKETDAICGCCSFYKKSALKTSGLGDEEFFLGPEDIELSFRLKKVGKIFYIMQQFCKF